MAFSDGPLLRAVRDANDRGYECLLLEDCAGATDHKNHLAAVDMVTQHLSVNL